MDLEEIRAEILSWRHELKASSAGLALELEPKTATDAIVSLVLRIADLASTGMAGAASGEIYSARALLRVSTEHFMRIMTILGDAQESGDDAAGRLYWSDLRRAEAVMTHDQIRRACPSGLNPADFPAPYKRVIERMVLEEAPTLEQVKAARELASRYGFKRMVKAAGDPSTTDPEGDRKQLGAVIGAHSLLSGCVHGGPEAHGALRDDPPATRLSAALDLAGQWALVLLIARDRLAKGADDDGLIKAQTMVERVARRLTEVGAVVGFSA